MERFTRLSNESGQWTLIGILLAMAIIVVLVLVLFARDSAISPESRLEQAAEESGVEVQVQPGQTGVGAVMDKSKEPICRSNLQQIRLHVQIVQGQSGQFPPMLDERKVGAGSILACPVSGQQYSYDPATGVVKCATPGHEQF